MKTILALQLFIFLTVNSFSQSADSLKVPTRNYKNTIQTTLLGFGGYFGLQYERALTKDWSLSLIGSYDFPFSQLNQPAPQPNTSLKSYSETFILQAELRYYLDKNEINNNGLYISGDIGYLYEIQYLPENRSSHYGKRRYPWFGGGIGYQLLIKKRFVIDAGAILQYGMKLHNKQSGTNTGWKKMDFREILFAPTLNIGFAF